MGTFIGFFLALVVISGVLFLIASFAFGRGEEMAAAPPDSTPVELPDDRPVSGADVRGLRLSVSARGYRMGEVDWVLEQLAIALEERDRELAALRPAAVPVTAPDSASEPALDPTPDRAPDPPARPADLSPGRPALPADRPAEPIKESRDA